ncbi:Calx-beta domain-containing protein [Modicisalibacter sp. 'Wilcox']|uniref:trypsin-like serine protease n=1 Tax=Modicisalibacter sp. 'Wilcox' TaxID=2679914 RepID=UPI001969F094|nr:Calx-beta domain-containing protein [Modicisalibacter sp. 'Wilcox']
MVTTTRTTDRYRVMPGEGYDGVAQVMAGGHYGSGTLLQGGRAVLTAAHVIEDAQGALSVNLDTVAGRVSIPVVEKAIYPNHDAANANGDLALLWLETPAPVTVERYGLYRETDEVGQPVSLVGYGLPGDGQDGHVASGSVAPSRHWAANRVDVLGEDLGAALDGTLSWSPAPGAQLIADFDDGSELHDALGRLAGLPDTGLGDAEGLIAPGDSGGPAFIDGKVAGVATYTASLSKPGVHPDVDATLDSSFGELAAWQRVSHYQGWIDQTLRAADDLAPSTPAEVARSVVEGDSGTTLAYFLVEFHGQRDDPALAVSVDYATRDGTAHAFEDYLPVADTLTLYPGEDQAAIAVEVIGDSVPEPDESFYLDVTHPVGGSFGEGVTTLTAVRTVVNDDGTLA